MNDSVLLSTLSRTCRSIYTIVAPILWSCLRFDCVLPIRSFNLALTLLSSPRNLVHHVQRIEFVFFEDENGMEYVMGWEGTECGDNGFSRLVEYEKWVLAVLAPKLPNLRTLNIQREIDILTLFTIVNGAGQIRTVETEFCRPERQKKGNQSSKYYEYPDFTSFDVIEIHDDDHDHSLDELKEYFSYTHPTTPIETLKLASIPYHRNEELYDNLHNWNLSHLRKLDLSYTGTPQEKLCQIVSSTPRLEALSIGRMENIPWGRPEEAWNYGPVIPVLQQRTPHLCTLLLDCYDIDPVTAFAIPYHLRTLKHISLSAFCDGPVLECPTDTSAFEGSWASLEAYELDADVTDRFLWHQLSLFGGCLRRLVVGRMRHCSEDGGVLRIIAKYCRNLRVLLLDHRMDGQTVEDLVDVLRGCAEVEVGWVPKPPCDEFGIGRVLVDLLDEAGRLYEGNFGHVTRRLDDLPRC
ncbi:hypothetical protein HDV00_000410 [Rhizophlyctis rosea]|nr:hypothetical protein HDV00_000410 [Rhizophlyctis rosea]